MFKKYLIHWDLKNGCVSTNKNSPKWINEIAFRIAIFHGVMSWIWYSIQGYDVDTQIVIEKTEKQIK